MSENRQPDFEHRTSFEHRITQQGLSFRYAKGASLFRGREFHDYHEIMYLIQVSGFFISEKKNIPLHPDMIIIIPQKTFHNFKLENESEYTRYCLNFHDTPDYGDLIPLCMNDIYILDNPGSKITEIFKELEMSFHNGLNDAEQRILLGADLARLMLELKLDTNKKAVTDTRDTNSLVAMALRYINEHYTDDISLERIARELHVSKSLLSHRFQKELNISVYRYITEKKLLLAKQLIKDGVPAVTASISAGFKDYSTFYRAYVKRYASPPSGAKL